MDDVPDNTNKRKRKRSSLIEYNFKNLFSNIMMISVEEIHIMIFIVD